MAPSGERLDMRWAFLTCYMKGSWAQSSFPPRPCGAPHSPSRGSPQVLHLMHNA